MTRPDDDPSVEATQAQPATGQLLMADKFELLAKGGSGDTLFASIKEALSQISDILRKRSLPITVISLMFEDHSNISLDASSAEKIESEGLVAAKESSPMKDKTPPALDELATKLLEDARNSIPSEGSQGQPDTKIDLNSKRPTEFVYDSDGNSFSIGVK